MSTSLPTVYGAAYSAYVRAVRLALVEKGVKHALVEVDVFGTGIPDWYAKIHPFKRIPAFEHDGFWLYESAAIMRYVDEAFAGPPLMPADARGRARVSQITGLLDWYLYRPLVWDIYVERRVVTAQGNAPDEGKIANAISRVDTCFAAIEALMSPAGPYLLGKELTLADLHLAPMISLGRHAPEGQNLIANHPRLDAWWETLRLRPSLAATATQPEA